MAIDEIDSLLIALPFKDTTKFRIRNYLSLKSEAWIQQLIINNEQLIMQELFNY